MQFKVGDGDSGDGGAIELSAGNAIAQGQAGGQVPKLVTSNAQRLFSCAARLRPLTHTRLPRHVRMLAGSRSRWPRIYKSDGRF